jgi:hypothetical protein
VTAARRVVPVTMLPSSRPSLAGITGRLYVCARLARQGRFRISARMMKAAGKFTSGKQTSLVFFGGCFRQSSAPS